MTRNNQSSFARNPTGTYSDQHNSPDKFKPPPPQPSSKEPAKDNNKLAKSLDNVNKSSKSPVKGAPGAKPGASTKAPQTADKTEFEAFDPRKNISPRNNTLGYWDPRIAPHAAYPYGFLPYLPGYPFP